MTLNIDCATLGAASTDVHIMQKFRSFSGGSRVKYCSQMVPISCPMPPVVGRRDRIGAAGTTAAQQPSVCPCSVSHTQQQQPTSQWVQNRKKCTTNATNAFCICNASDRVSLSLSATSLPPPYIRDGGRTKRPEDAVPAPDVSASDAAARIQCKHDVPAGGRQGHLPGRHEDQVHGGVRRPRLVEGVGQRGL